MKPREIGESPFCWQAKIVHDAILEAFEHTKGIRAASALSVYCGLTRIASDCGNDCFTTTVANIARNSGQGNRTVTKVLEKFESIGVIHIKRNYVKNLNLQTASTYTLQSVDEIFSDTEITLCKFYTPPSKIEENSNMPTYKEI